MCAQVEPTIEEALCGKPMETITLERGKQFAYTEGLQEALSARSSSACYPLGAGHR